MSAPTRHTELSVLGARHLAGLPELARFSPAEREAMRAVAAVLPFRVNRYVVEELIDWERAPDDPMFRLTFPHPDMLTKAELARMIEVLRSGDGAAVRAAARDIQRTLNPHPAGQLELNVPAGGRDLQHKYEETVLLFPAPGQTCHTYCTYCFRWPQFVDLEDMKLAGHEPERFADHVRRHPRVESALFTGGDPMVMKTHVLRRYVEPLLSIESLASVRFGTKALAYWPQRFVTDSDADDLLRLFEEIRAAGKHVAVMAHYSHPRELRPEIARRAVARVRSAGATVRSQAPVIRRVNDDASVWARMWRDQVRLGISPYYLFVERDTGPRRYFEVPLARALEIHRDATRAVCGLARTARGPVMSCTPGKILVDGVTEIAGERVFALRMLQGRDPSWVGELFFARFDPRACWIDELAPAFGAGEWFFQPELRARLAREGRDPGPVSVPSFTSATADAE